MRVNSCVNEGGRNGFQNTDPAKHPMTPEQLQFLAVKGMLHEMPVAEQEAARELIDHIKRACHVAGDAVAAVSIAFIGAELAARQ